MKTYNKIKEVLQTEKAKDLIAIMQNPENRTMKKLKAEDELENNIAEHIKKEMGIDDSFEVPNINKNGKDTAKAYSFHPHAIAKYILKESNIKIATR